MDGKRMDVKEIYNLIKETRKRKENSCFISEDIEEFRYYDSVEKCLTVIQKIMKIYGGNKKKK